MDADRRTRCVMSLGGRFHREPRMGVQAVERAGHLDHAGSDSAVTNALGELRDEKVGEPVAYPLDQIWSVVRDLVQPGRRDDMYASLSGDFRERVDAATGAVR